MSLTSREICFALHVFPQFEELLDWNRLIRGFSKSFNLKGFTMSENERVSVDARG
jgi:hypothetical protein